MVEEASSEHFVVFEKEIFCHHQEIDRTDGIAPLQRQRRNETFGLVRLVPWPAKF